MSATPYDNDSFFEKYSRMSRSVKGLEGAGEWPTLEPMLPDFKGKRVLDLGCGFGWHCRYAAERGAKSVLGIDSSEKMLLRARAENNAPRIEYRRLALEDASFPPSSFDVVISSLVFHYVKDFRALCRNVFEWLVSGGSFVFSVEHPVFTAQGRQTWISDENGKPLFWPVDRYFEEGERIADFLGEDIVKYHRTLTAYLSAPMQTGFVLKELREPQPTAEMLKSLPEMKDELRRPMMLILSWIKK